ncbi:MAG: polysaccharide deacetylase family protein [Gammaproteobacteria bacterium]|nr:polysaccharide deacetylase family protein [Gammaproteobacteria bacterium]
MVAQKKRCLLLVNYHYIRGRSQYAYPGIHPLERAAFVEQLTFLRDRFHLASPEEVEDFSHGRAALPRASIFFTFDDGLAEHVTIAREILNPLGIKAAFFVASRPLMEQKAIMVHKVHWLRATTEPEKFASEFVSLLPDAWSELAETQDISREAIETYVYDTPKDARIKYLINFQLPADVVDDVTSEMLRRRKLHETAFCRDLYMDENQIIELADAGHIVGSHGHTHTPFTRLNEDLLRHEIETNLDCLENVMGARPVWVSYPYGNEWAIPDDPGSFCRRFGFSIGLTLSRDWNDGTQSPYALNRINNNELREMI